MIQKNWYLQKEIEYLEFLIKRHDQIAKVHFARSEKANDEEEQFYHSLCIRTQNKITSLLTGIRQELLTEYNTQNEH